MKELKCSRCSFYLGEMEKGKLKKDASILCKSCMDALLLCESLSTYSKGTKPNMDMPDFFKDIFNKGAPKV